MIRRIVAIGLLLLLPAQSFALIPPDPPATSLCMADLLNAVGREQRLYRAALFGKVTPEDAVLHSKRYDRDGTLWVKTGDDEWKSPTEGKERAILDDGTMEVREERDLLCEGNIPELEASCVQTPRRGIYQIRKTPTSDLTEPVIQSLRALQCRLRAICELAASSPGAAPGEAITITIDGCLPMTFPAMEGCRDAQLTIFETLPGACQVARQQLVEREIQLLHLLAAYDASYRSLLQFAGMFQEFLTQFRFPLIEPLWRTLRILGNLKDIPCFQAECNE